MKSIFSFFNQYRHFTLLLSIAWTVLIFIGCSLPGKELPKLGLFDHFDKIVHFLFFAIFHFLWKCYFSSSPKTNFIIFAIAVLYGFALEYYQMRFVAGRSFDVWDGVADTLGALSAWVLMSLTIDSRSIQKT